MLFQHVDFDSHEQVIFCHDPDIGLNGIIALHSTALGPAAGGMMGASTVIFTEPSRAKSLQQIENLHETISSIIGRAKAEGRTTDEIADTIAKERISAAQNQ